MENLITGVSQHKTLADAYPPQNNEAKGEGKNSQTHQNNLPTDIYLYDVVYACIENGGK